jgi:hypothetical protein
MRYLHVWRGWTCRATTGAYVESLMNANQQLRLLYVKKPHPFSRTKETQAHPFSTFRKYCKEQHPQPSTMANADPKIAQLEAVIHRVFTNKLYAAEGLQMDGLQPGGTVGNVYVQGQLIKIEKNTNIAVLGDSIMASIMCEKWFNHRDTQGTHLTHPTIHPSPSSFILIHYRQPPHQRRLEHPPPIAQQHQPRPRRLRTRHRRPDPPKPRLSLRVQRNGRHDRRSYLRRGLQRRCGCWRRWI